MNYDLLQRSCWVVFLWRPRNGKGKINISATSAPRAQWAVKPSNLDHKPKDETII
jgi:hypothetical protein